LEKIAAAKLDLFNHGYLNIYFKKIFDSYTDTKIQILSFEKCPNILCHSPNTVLKVQKND